MGLIGALVMLLGFLMMSFMPDMSDKDEKYYFSLAIFCMVSGLVTMVIGWSIA